MVGLVHTILFTQMNTMNPPTIIDLTQEEESFSGIQTSIAEIFETCLEQHNDPLGPFSERPIFEQQAINALVFCILQEYQVSKQGRMDFIRKLVSDSFEKEDKFSRMYPFLHMHLKGKVVDDRESKHRIY